MIYFPETINTISTTSPTHLHTFSLGYARELTLCMLASWSHEGVVFLDFLLSPHLVTSFLFPCLGSTDTLCSRLGGLVPLPPRWRPYSQGPRTLPYRDPEQFHRLWHRAPCVYCKEKKFGKFSNFFVLKVWMSLTNFDAKMLLNLFKKYIVNNFLL